VGNNSRARPLISPILKFCDAAGKIYSKFTSTGAEDV
jgi:hypothetical protein